MYAKYFFERFWDGEQKNELFVCMPFHDLFDEKFAIIDSAAKDMGFDKASRVKEEWDANVITDKIFDGIANSRMLLFDLSDDPKSPCQFLKRVNENVLYELGVANAIREPSDMVLIREETTTKLPFDVSGLTVNSYKKHELRDWLIEKLTSALDNQKWHKSKRVRVAAESMDEIGLHLMCTNGRYPHGKDLLSRVDSPQEKMGVLRLVDLGILWFNAKWLKNGYEFAYYWTPFGYEVMKYLEIDKLSEVEFERSPYHEHYLKGLEEYNKFKERMDK